jgi:hypothetical protein
MALETLQFPNVTVLLKQHLSTEENPSTAALIRELRQARVRGYLTRQELEKVCRWKSARAIHLINRNSATRVRTATRRALATRSERLRLQALRTLDGVDVPMASAILMLLNPRRYGVIDIRVWQLLYAFGEVTKKSSGVGFNFKIGNQDIGVYSLHLKSNLIVHGNKEAETAKNIQKREVAITQLLTHVRDVIGTRMPTIKGVVIGGDFNTNHYQAMFAAEGTLDTLADAGYHSGFEELALSQRITHPGTHAFPDATFDFLFAKNLTALQPTITQTNASDHWPVTRNFRLP